MELKELKEKVKEFKKVAQEKQAATEQALFERLFEFFGEVYTEREGLLDLFTLLNEIFSVRKVELPHIVQEKEGFGIEVSKAFVLNGNIAIREAVGFSLKIAAEGEKVFLVCNHREKGDLWRFELPKDVSTLEELYSIYCSVGLGGLYSEDREKILQAALSSSFDKNELEEVAAFSRRMCFHTGDSYIAEACPGFDGSVKSAVDAVEYMMYRLPYEARDRYSMKDDKVLLRFLTRAAAGIAAHRIFGKMKESGFADWDAVNALSTLFEKLMERCQETVKAIENAMSLFLQGKTE